MTDPWARPADIATPSFERFGTVMVTGHRRQHLGPEEQAWVKIALARTAWRLRSAYGMEHAITGMALGADLWWAQAAMACGADLHAYVPFPTQPDPWAAEDRALWAETLACCVTTKMVLDRAPADRGEAVRNLHARNDAMLSQTQRRQGLVVAVWKSEITTGGTASAVKKARSLGLPLLIHDPTTRRIRREGWPGQTSAAHL